MAQRWTCTGCTYSAIYRTAELAEALFPKHPCRPTPPRLSDLPACRGCGRPCIQMADYDSAVCFRCDAATEAILMRASLTPEHRKVYAADPMISAAPRTHLLEPPARPPLDVLAGRTA